MRFLKRRINRLNLELQHSARYWDLRRWLDNVDFRIARLRFDFGTWLENQRQSLVISWQILVTILGQLLIAVLIVAGLYVVDGQVTRYLPDNVEFIPRLPSMDRAEYISLLATASQVAAIFLGLYFATVSVILSTAYADTSRQLRDRIIREQFGNTYIRLVALFGAVSWSLYALSVFGYGPARLGIVAIGFLGLFAVFSFVVLGLRLFYFLDPTVLSHQILSDASKWIARAERSRRRSDHPIFQDYYRRRCESLIDIYGELISKAVSSEWTTNGVLVTLAKQSLDFMAYYSLQKTKIPTSSNWYPDQYVHKDWLRADSDELALALSSSVTLLPKVEKDTSWLERLLRQSIASITDGLKRRGDFKSIYAVLLHSDRQTQFLARNAATAEAVEQVRFAQEYTQSVLGSGRDRKSTTHELSQKHAEKLAIIDAVGLHTVSLLLGISESVRSGDQVLKCDQLTPEQWPNLKRVADVPRPRVVLRRLEDLAWRIDNDQVVEGRSVVPRWYVRHITAHAYAQYLVKAANSITEALERSAEDVDRFVDHEDFVSAVQLMTRVLEGLHKAEYHIQTLRQFDEELSLAKTGGELPPWPAVNWNAIDEQLAAIELRTWAQLAQVSPTLAAMEREPEHPDLFGYAYNHLSQKVFHSVLRQDLDTVRKLFPAFLTMSFHAYENRRQHLTNGRNQGDEIDWAILLDILVDAADLSGIAVAIGELAKTELTQVVEETWNRMLSGNEDESSTLQSLITLVDQRERSFLVGTPRSMIRLSWRQHLGRELADCGVVSGIYDPIEGGSIIRGTDSPIVAALTAGGMVITSPCYAFFAWYLRQHGIVSDLQVPELLEDFMKSVEYAEKRLKTDESAHGTTDQ